MEVLTSYNIPDIDLTMPKVLAQNLPFDKDVTLSLKHWYIKNLSDIDLTLRLNYHHIIYLSDIDLTLWWKYWHISIVSSLTSVSRTLSWDISTYSKNLLATNSKASCGHAYNINKYIFVYPCFNLYYELWIFSDNFSTPKHLKHFQCNFPKAYSAPKSSTLIFSLLKAFDMTRKEKLSFYCKTTNIHVSKLSQIFVNGLIQGY